MTTPHITCLHELSGHTDRVWCVTWSPNGKLLATCGGDHTIRLWSTSNYTLVATLSDGHKRTVRSVRFHPSGTKLASASFDGTTMIWERNQWDSEWESVATLEGHENEVKSVSFSIGGSLLATSSRDKTIWLWEVEEDNEFDCLAVLSDHEQDVKYVQWHPHEDILASASYDDTIKVFEEVQSTDEWQCTQTFSGHMSTVWCLAWDPTGAYLASASDDSTVKIWSRETGDCVHTFGPFSRTLYAVSWTVWQNRGHIVAVGADDTIRVFSQTKEKGDWQLACQLDAAHASDINSVAWRPLEGTPLCPASPSTQESLVFATASDDGVVKVWQYHPNATARHVDTN